MVKLSPHEVALNHGMNNSATKLLLSYCYQAIADPGLSDEV